MIKQFIISGHVSATSRLRLPSEQQKNLQQVTQTVNEYNGKITNVVCSIPRPYGPFGNVIQDITVTVEGDYDDPKYKEMYDKYNQAMASSNNSGCCYVATSVYGSYDCPQVWVLRRYRDDRLAKSWYGRIFVRVYYAISPTLVKLFGETKWFKSIWRKRLDNLVNKLQNEGVDNTPYNDRNW